MRHRAQKTPAELARWSPQLPPPTSTLGFALRQPPFHEIIRFRAGLDLERTLFNELAQTEDREEGRRAFRERRAPQFKGR